MGITLSNDDFATEAYARTFEPSLAPAKVSIRPIFLVPWTRPAAKKGGVSNARCQWQL
jgi:hypothetical protein